TPLSIKHKLGIHGPPTCVLEYDDATGYLIGEENQGMRIMFVMMNNARLSVGLQGVALAERAYQASVDYAVERIQGRAIGATKDPPIIDFPDVRRMLMTPKATIAAIRPLLYLNAGHLDLNHYHADADRMLMTQQATIAAMRRLMYLNAGHMDVRHFHPDEEVRARAEEIVGLLTPICKSWGTDMGFELTSTALQVFGGMGYIEETGVAQHMRDVRITSIYEGTNGVQAADLVGRKLGVRNGSSVLEFLEQMGEVDGELEAAGDEFASIRSNFSTQFDALGEATKWMFMNGP